MRDKIREFFGELMGLFLMFALMDGGGMLYKFLKYGTSENHTLCSVTNLCDIDTQWVGVWYLFFHFVNTPVWKWSLWGAVLCVVMALPFVNKEKSY